jgi:processive 1,2-diacylglycerol beta-glucosyltransferase
MGATTSLVDAYVESGRVPLPWFPAAYAWLARDQPLLWALLFHASSIRPNADAVLRPLLRDGFRRRLDAERPDIVVSVLPMINGVLAEATHALGARFEVVLTDWHSIHRFWIAPGVDHYTAPTETARADCVRFGAPSNAVDVLGIPVRRAFARAERSGVDRAHILSRLGLEAGRFTILMMVGAEGSPRALANLRRLLRLGIDAQVVVVCGRNNRLRQRVERLPARLTVRALGFVEHIAELMRSADLLVTKAGGLTLAEAFCCGVPVVVYDILAGQEAGNLEYALRYKAVEHSTSSRRLARVVGELYADATRRAELAARGRRLARPDAAERISQALLDRGRGASSAQLGGDG